MASRNANDCTVFNLGTAIYLHHILFIFGAMIIAGITINRISGPRMFKGEMKVYEKLALTTVLLISAMVTRSQEIPGTAFRRYEYTFPGSQIKFTMVPIRGGVFFFGSNDKDKLREKDEQPEKKVNISPFWIGAHEVTFDEYNLFFRDATLSQNIITDAVTRPSSPYIDMTLGMGKDGGFPANSMQQYGALMYCKWLYKKTGIFYRLPTEAEWEYACRAGSQSVYPWGDDASKLNEYAWYNDNSENRYHKVGQKKPNAWGLYDMLGNVSEWVLDQYDEKYYATITDNARDPFRQPETRHPRTVRGGAYNSEANELRTANRQASDPVWNRRDPQIPKSRWWNADAPFVGFRIVRPLKQPTAEEANKFFDTLLGF